MLDHIRRITNRTLAVFRSGARTVGLSPKALAPLIGVAIAWVADLAGLPVDPVTVALIAGTLAAALLPPGHVAVPEGFVSEGSDARLGPEARAEINR